MSNNQSEQALSKTVEKTDAEWRKQLTSEQYEVTRAQGTEKERLLTELRRLERQQGVARAKLQALAEINR